MSRILKQHLNELYSELIRKTSIEKQKTGISIRKTLFPERGILINYNNDNILFYAEIHVYTKNNKEFIKVKFFPTSLFSRYWNKDKSYVIHQIRDHYSEKDIPLYVSYDKYAGLSFKKKYIYSNEDIENITNNIFEHVNWFAGFLKYINDNSEKFEKLA